MTENIFQRYAKRYKENSVSLHYLTLKDKNPFHASLVGKLFKPLPKPVRLIGRALIGAPLVLINDIVAAPLASFFYTTNDYKNKAPGGATALHLAFLDGDNTHFDKIIQKAQKNPRYLLELLKIKHAMSNDRPLDWCCFSNDNSIHFCNQIFDILTGLGPQSVYKILTNSPYFLPRVIHKKNVYLFKKIIDCLIGDLQYFLPLAEATLIYLAESFEGFDRRNIHIYNDSNIRAYVSLIDQLEKILDIQLLSAPPNPDNNQIRFRTTLLHLLLRSSDPQLSKSIEKILDHSLKPNDLITIFSEPACRALHNPNIPRIVDYLSPTKETLLNLATTDILFIMIKSIQKLSPENLTHLFSTEPSVLISYLNRFFVVQGMLGEDLGQISVIVSSENIIKASECVYFLWKHMSDTARNKTFSTFNLNPTLFENIPKNIYSILSAIKPGNGLVDLNDPEDSVLHQTANRQGVVLRDQLSDNWEALKEKTIQEVKLLISDKIKDDSELLLGALVIISLFPNSDLYKAAENLSGWMLSLNHKIWSFHNTIASERWYAEHQSYKNCNNNLSICDAFLMVWSQLDTYDQKIKSLKQFGFNIYENIIGVKKENLADDNYAKILHYGLFKIPGFYVFRATESHLVQQAKTEHALQLQAPPLLHASRRAEAHRPLPRSNSIPNLGTRTRSCP